MTSRFASVTRSWSNKLALLTLSELSALRDDIVFNTSLLGHPLTFHSTWGVFSPREVDKGTILLLEHMEIKPDHDCIDLGCGYGPLGLAMAASAPGGITHMIDKDFVAVDFTQKNAKLNSLANVEIYLSNGFSAVPPATHFDTVVSNLPAKAGKELFYLYFYDARSRLKPGGKIYVVTINGLRQFIKRAFTEVFGNYKKLKQGKDYTISMAEMDPAIGAIAHNPKL